MGDYAKIKKKNKQEIKQRGKIARKIPCTLREKI